MLDSKKDIDRNKFRMQALCIWGKEDAAEEQKKGVAGIDYPVNPGVLSNWG